MKIGKLFKKWKQEWKEVCEESEEERQARAYADAMNAHERSYLKGLRKAIDSSPCGELHQTADNRAATERLQANLCHPSGYSLKAAGSTASQSKELSM